MKIPEELLPVVEWWEKNGKRAVVIAVVAGLAALAGWAWTARRERNRQASGDASLTAARTVVPGHQTPDAVDAVANLIDAYGSSENGAAIKLEMAMLKYRLGKTEGYEEALAIYDALLADDPADIYKDVAAVGRAYCLEALGRYGEAREAYAKFVVDSPKSAYALDARLGEARSLAADGKKAEAIALLETIAAESGSTDATGVIAMTEKLVKGWVDQVELKFAPPPAPEPEEVPAEAAPESVEVAPAPAEAAPAPAPAEAPADAK